MVCRREVLPFLAIVCLLSPTLSGCKGRTDSRAAHPIEKPIPVTAPRPASPPQPPAQLPAATPDHVKEAVRRVFGDDLVLPRGNDVAFIVGDFNGDRSQDLGVIARPAAGKLDDINGELANWIIQDADRAFIPPARNQHTVIIKNPGPVKIAAGEDILVIIHGYGPEGWRNPDSRQAYIVKHAAARFTGTAPSISEKAIRAMHLPVETDIIKEVRNNQKGFLFWTGGNYAWHPSTE